MEKEKRELETAGDSEVMEESEMVLRFRKPYCFEGKEYEQIDLSGLEDMTAKDMIAVNNYMKRTGGGVPDNVPELSMEFACVLSARAAKQPIEFFTGLPAREAIRVKNRVTGFLFR